MAIRWRCNLEQPDRSYLSLIGPQGLRWRARFDPGADGKEVLMQVSNGYIQWQYVGDQTWNNLVALSVSSDRKVFKAKPGSDGKEVLMQVANGYIQWQYVGDTTWNNLIALSSLIGPQGLDGVDGSDGVDGKEVLMQVSGGYIQWQYVGDETLDESHRHLEL
ncbi:MAG: hypothetical protein MZU97_25845 [Bacillus subtilis]|nr:hypothetical protein [Bacillus subtilis]